MSSLAVPAITGAPAAEVIAFDDLDSTNAEALRRAGAGARGPLWVTAARQTAGRGRRGRVWVSQAGNLHASLLLHDPAPARDAAQISFVAALAVHDAIVAVTPALRDRLTLKWPNDALCAGRKIAGILVEGETRRGLTVVVGIGINCRHHPDDVMYPATDLAAEGADASPEVVFAGLARAMRDRLAQWDRGAAFASIREDWLARGPAPGAPLRVRLPASDVAGTFETIDEHGNLIVCGPEGPQKIVAGDVLLPAVAGSSPSADT
jgi:BirA family biotin operon repressor/biotin-[acetyl-CoA-carboxylase] ligase